MRPRRCLIGLSYGGDVYGEISWGGMPRSEDYVASEYEREARLKG